eukprot:606612-Heterocapsa_arctica.AAC.1
MVAEGFSQVWTATMPEPLVCEVAFICECDKPKLELLSRMFPNTKQMFSEITEVGKGWAWDVKSKGWAAPRDCHVLAC